MLLYVHSSLICNTQMLETTQMSFNRGMNTEIVVHVHNRTLSIKKVVIMSFSGKWMKIENIIFSEATQTQKATCGMYSLISGY